MITLYDAPLSGNCHKVRMLLGFLSLPYQIRGCEFIENCRGGVSGMGVNQHQKSGWTFLSGRFCRDYAAFCPSAGLSPGFMRGFPRLRA